MEEIKFSIIIPVYNCETFIEDCIKSIFKQEYNNFEIIVVDDGSTDKSLIICQKIATNDNRIHIYHKSNGGVSSARNKGLEHISGDYVLFVDADDMLTPKCLQNYYYCIIKESPDVCYQQYKIIKNSVEPMYTNDYISSNNNLYKQIQIDDFYSFFNKKWILFSATWSKCYKTSIIKKFQIHFSININLYEDFLFLTEYLSHAKSVYIVYNTGYIYRVVKNSLSRRKNTQIENYINYILYKDLTCFSIGFALKAYQLWIKHIIINNYCEINKNTRYRIINTSKFLNLSNFSNKSMIPFSIMVRTRTPNIIIDLYLNIIQLIKQKMKILFN